MLNTDFTTLGLLLAIGACHRQLQQHAIDLRSSPNVKAILRSTLTPEVQECFRLEEYVDAELLNGEAISWFVELNIFASGMTVEASVTKIRDGDCEVDVHIDVIECNDIKQMSETLAEVTSQICNHRPLAIGENNAGG